jgi:TPR repeat protein
MASYSATTLLTVGRDALRAGPGQKLLKAVQKAVAGDYEVLGEMGRGAKGRIVYLGREMATRHLVALQLTPGEGSQERGEIWLDVLRKLDASVPSGDDKCPRCGGAIQGWARYCSLCGADLSGVAPGSDANTSVDQLLSAVKEAAGKKYEVLGQMDRAEGGGVVYFSRERGTNNIVALRLQRKGHIGGRGQYELGRTMVLQAVVEKMAGKDVPEPPAVDARHVAEAPAAPAAGPASALAQPAAPRSTRSDRRTVAMVGGGILLLLALGLWLSRSTPSPGPKPHSTAVAVVESMPPIVDSAQVDIGGTLPPKASLTVDGSHIDGRTVRLAPGTHEFLAKAPGYLPSSQTLELQPGQLMTWTPQLVRASVRRPPPTTASQAPPPSTPAAQTDTVAPLAIHQIPSTPVVADTQPVRALTTSEATCAMLFSNLEWSRALAACEKEATAGGTAAQRALATMYERGLATETNLGLAAEWYGKAAANGDRVAQYRLGVLLRSGRGVRKDEKAAVEWFRKSAEQGEADAQLALAQAYDKGQGIKRSRSTAARWYLKAAEQGSAAAQFRLGQFYAKGEAGLPRSEPDAIKWFRLAAAQGHRDAQEEMAKRGASR